MRTFSPTALGSIDIPGYANNVDANGNFAYVAAGAAGLVVIDVSAPAAPSIVGVLDTPGNANDVRVAGNSAYVADGSAGLQIIDVTDPTMPRLAGSIDTSDEANDVMVSGTLAFVADGHAGVHIIDVANPSAPSLVKTVVTPGFARGVDVNGSIVVVATDQPNRGLSVIDISNVANAAVVGSVALGGQPIDVSFENRRAYVAAYTGGMFVVDVQNPSAPAVIGNIDGSVFVPRDVQAAGRFALFAEQLFANAVAPIVNVSDPSSPQLVDVLNFGVDYAGTGIAISGPFVFWTGRGFVVGDENGTTGSTKLFTGQYISLEDNEGVPPTVSITAPVDGTTVMEGESVTVCATAADDIAVAAVTFTRDGVEVYVDTAAPFEYTFVAPTGVTSITVAARAIDLGGNTGTAEPLGINVTPDPLTTVTGRVVDEAGQPVEGATVTLLNRSVPTGADGRFAIAGVPTAQPRLTLRVSMTREGTVLTGFSAPTAPVRGGTTDVGDVVARATTFEQDLGTRLVGPCNSCHVNVTLPFDFPIAGGTRRDVRVSDGYIWTPEDDYLEVLCCSFIDDTTDPLTGTYLNDQLPGRVVITWRNQRKSIGSQPSTAQLILFDDGRIQYGYREVNDQQYWYVGLFPAGYSTYREVDFSAGAGTVAPDEAVEEGFSSGNPFDLAGGFIVFTPATGGGYTTRTIGDLVPPMCTIINPAHGSTLLAGEHLSIQVDPSDNIQIRNVTIQSSVGGLNANLLQSPYSAPFVVPLNVAEVTFTATARDSWNNSTTCVSTVSVVPGSPPISTIELPGSPSVITAGQTLWITIDAANRVPVTSVDLMVEGTMFGTDTAAPFEFAVMVPSGVTSLTLSSVATDYAGHTGNAAPATLQVLADPLTRVEGVVADRSDAPVGAAAIALMTQGISAEIFDFSTPLSALPDLTGRSPDRVKVLSGLDLRNPGLIFGADPFGLGSAASRAIRLGATLRGTTDGTYTFTLGVGGGGRLIVNGQTVVDLPTSTGQFQQATGSVYLPGGAVALQLVAFDNGNPEVQLSYGLSDGPQKPVHMSLITPAVTPYGTTTAGDGTFGLDGVSTVTGPVTALASATISGRLARGQSLSFDPMPGGITDVGRIRLSGGKIGLLHCDPGAPAIVRAGMVATGHVTNDEVVEIDVCSTPPTLAEMSELGSVLVWSNYPFGQRDALGDVLADYVDQGGGVVLATYAFSNPWGIGGRIATVDYAPFAVSAERLMTSGMLDLAASNTAHPLMQGVIAGPYFTNHNYTNPALAPGASLIAVDTAGNRVVAISASGRVVGISIWPGYPYHYGGYVDMSNLFTNAVLFAR